MIDIYNVSLVDVLPDSLKSDEDIKAIAEALSIELQEIARQIKEVLLLDNIDELNEGIIDHLLYQYHMTDDEGAALATTLDEKKNLVRNAIKLHRTKGTKAALVEVLKLLNMRGIIEEWFEYEGEPYHFRIQILEVTSRGMSEENLLLLDKLVCAYKNTRSWLDAINIYLTSMGKTYIAATTTIGENITVYPWSVSGIETSGKYILGSATQTIETLTVYPE